MGLTQGLRQRGCSPPPQRAPALPVWLQASPPHPARPRCPCSRGWGLFPSLPAPSSGSCLTHPASSPDTWSSSRPRAISSPVPLAPGGASPLGWPWTHALSHPHSTSCLAPLWPTGRCPGRVPPAASPASAPALMGPAHSRQARTLPPPALGPCTSTRPRSRHPQSPSLAAPGGPQPAHPPPAPPAPAPARSTAHLEDDAVGLRARGRVQDLGVAGHEVHQEAQVPLLLAREA